MVIAIIALLVSILLPSLRRARELAARAVCLTSARANANAATMYAAEHERFPPSGLYTPDGDGEGERVGPWFHRDLMGNYLGLDTTTDWPAATGTALCPARPVLCSTSWVGYNASMCSATHYEARKGYDGIDQFGYSRAFPYVIGPLIDDVENGTEKVVLFEDSCRETFLYVADWKTVNVATGETYPTSPWPDDPPDTSRLNSRDERHDGGANYSFMDTHAEHLPDPNGAFLDGQITQFVK